MNVIMIVKYTIVNCDTEPEKTLTSSVDLTQVGEAPHIAQTHSKPNTGQQVLNLVVPLWPLFSLNIHTQS